MEGHNQWIKRGFDDIVFLLAGSLEPGAGGAVIAYNTSLPGLQNRVNEAVAGARAAYSGTLH